MRRILVLAFLVALLGGPVAIRAGPSDAGRPVDQVLKGRFLKLDGDRVEIKYDFSDPAQLEDWISTKPFRVLGEVKSEFENKTVRLEGTGAWCHRALFDDEVSLAFDLKPWTDKDLGAVVMESIESDQFVLFSLNDIYFQKFDGVRIPQHMITRFGVKDDSDGKNDQAFRYIARGKSPVIRKYETVRMTAEKNGIDDSMTIGDKKYSGVEMGRKLNDIRIGVYMVEGKAVVDNVVVKGRLSERWLEKENVALTLSRPLAVEEPESRAERVALDKIEKRKAGELPPKDLLAVVSDPDVTEETRQAAATAVEESGDKTVVPHLVPLLYSADDATRELAFGIVRKLVGRTFGYNPKGDPDKRSAAIQKLVQHIQKNASEFGTSR